MPCSSSQLGSFRRSGQVIEQIAQAAEVSKSAAERAVDALVSAIKTSLKKGDMVTLVGFGTFYVGKRKARAALRSLGAATSLADVGAAPSTNRPSTTPICRSHQPRGVLT